MQAKRSSSRKPLNRSARPMLMQWLLTLACITVVIAFCHNWLAKQSVRHVEISGNLNYVDKAQLQRSIQPLLRDGMLQLAIQDISAAVLANDWVAAVKLRKRWPNTLLVSIEEQRPVANWQDGGYLNYRGEAFFPKTKQAEIELPALSGPDGAGSEVLRVYQHLSGVLMADGIKVERLQRNILGNFSAVLSNGIALSLGADDVQANINKFAFIYETNLAASANKVAAVDLRYNNGAAVAWRNETRLAGLPTSLQNGFQGGLYER